MYSKSLLQEKIKDGKWSAWRLERCPPATLKKLCAALDIKAFFGRYEIWVRKSRKFLLIGAIGSPHGHETGAVIRFVSWFDMPSLRNAELLFPGQARPARAGRGEG